MITIDRYDVIYNYMTRFPLFNLILTGCPALRNNATKTWLEIFVREETFVAAAQPDQGPAPPPLKGQELPHAPILQ